ncbi:MAG: hypothetical protein P4L84_19775 [Isosphaeraceae bacterium]|nr:hypothetical protein [Isosphaeraceae bacterium]
MKSSSYSTVAEECGGVATAQGTLARRGLRSEVGDLVLLAVLPVALIALNPNWIVSGLFNDPWIYFGYYFNLPGYLRAFENAYYGTRLSVILPGYLAYSVLPPLSANLVLHLGLYEAGVLAHYALVRRVCGRRAALLGSLLLGTNPFFLEAVGHDYVDGYGIVYFLLAELFVAIGAGSRRPVLAAGAAGVATAALVVANLGYGLLAPFVLAFFLVLNGDRRGPFPVRACLAFGLGVAAVLAAFSLLTGEISGRYGFLGPNFDFVAKTSKAPNPFKDRSHAWFLACSWLVTPALVAVSGSARLLRALGEARGGRSTPSSFLQWQFLGFFLILAGLEFVVGSIHLQAWYYASLLVPFTFLALSAQWAPLVERLSGRQFIALMTVGVVASVPAMAVPRTAGAATLLGLPPIVPIAMLAIAVVALLLDRSAGLKVQAATLVLFGLLQCLSWWSFREEVSVPLLNADPDYWRRQARALPPRNLRPYGVRMHDYDRNRVDVLRTMAEAVQAMRGVDATGFLFVWFDLAEPDGVLFNNIACTQTWGSRLINLDFPASDGRTLARDPLAPGMKIVILSGRPGALSRARAALRFHGFDAQPIGERRIEHGTIAFTMTFLSLTRPDAALKDR